MRFFPVFDESVGFSSRPHFESKTCDTTPRSGRQNLQVHPGPARVFSVAWWVPIEKRVRLDRGKGKQNMKRIPQDWFSQIGNNSRHGVGSNEAANNYDIKIIDI
jgi:hypothetical protein